MPQSGHSRRKMTLLRHVPKTMTANFVRVTPLPIYFVRELLFSEGGSMTVAENRMFGIFANGVRPQAAESRFKTVRSLFARYRATTGYDEISPHL